MLKMKGGERWWSTPLSQPHRRINPPPAVLFHDQREPGTLAARRCSLANFAERFVRTTSLSALCARSGLPPSEFDRKCDPRPSELAETLRECGRPLAFARILTKKPTVGGSPACCALRVARQPLRRASEQRDKLAPPSLARLACAIRAGLKSSWYLLQN